MSEKYVIGHAAMPKLGRIKTGFTARAVPKLRLESIGTSSESAMTESEYSGTRQP